MPTPTALAHDALFYGGDEEFVAAVAPFLRGGLRLGEGAVAVTTRTNIGLLRDALGVDATRVTFHDRDDWYSRPATVVAQWRRLLDEEAARGHAYVRIIGEVGFGPPDRHPTWTRYESALNTLFAAVPAWIVCPYDRRHLPPAVLADARRTHPVLRDRGRFDSHDYVNPDRLLRTVPEPAPDTAGPPRLVRPIGGEDDVAALRQVVRAAVGERARVDDLVVAVSEVVTNALRHGRGLRVLRLWLSEPVVVVEVTDEGPGLADPLAGLRQPGPEVTGGRGLWLVHQLCDAIAINRDDRVNRVRFAITLG